MERRLCYSGGMSGCITVDHFETWSPEGTTRFSAGDRVLWRDPLGIGGVIIAAVILEAITFAGGELCVLALNVEPSEVLRAVAQWARESVIRPDNWPKHMFGDGGFIAVAGDEFRRAVYAGNIRHAGKDESARAKDEVELRAMPEWWATRREDLQRANAED